jgi:hypothetical protein
MVVSVYVQENVAHSVAGRGAVSALWERFLCPPQQDRRQTFEAGSSGTKEYAGVRHGNTFPRTALEFALGVFGINRPDGKRTAPSAMNRQVIDIYVLLRDGVYLYDAQGHRLQPVAAGDLRGMTGTQDSVGRVPLNLVYVANYSKMAGTSEPDKRLYSAAKTGFIGQNVYLYCASAGLATAVRATMNREKFAAAVKLRSDQKITLAQRVGYPKR